jgi:site-specific DNA-methyltransferase (adenine-specific)
VKALPRNVILAGDAREVVPGLLAESVDCVVTSPPYFHLRDYDLGPDQIGQEAAVQGWVENLRQLCRELYRVLKPSGSLWLNLGDTYSRHHRLGAPAKSLLLAPERLALGLIEDGFTLRNRVVWQKPNPLPEAVTDRLSSTYELVYFFSKQRRYFFDLDAIRIPHRSGKGEYRGRPTESGRTYQGGNRGLGRLKAAGRVGHPNGKNPGDVWTLPTALDREGHFATFPTALVEPAIRATCPERICVQCDSAWTRPVRTFTLHTAEGTRSRREVGELRRCDCFAPSRPGLVLDPFFGTGTVGVAAAQLGRDWLGIELSAHYRELARRRLNRIDPEAA